LILDRLLASLDGSPEPDSILADFIPPGRFETRHFRNYHPLHPTQAAAARRLLELSVDLGRSSPGLLRGFFSRRQPPAGAAGVYLDGGFGVGKTHLLAALWNESAGPKAYLSFDELTYFIGLVGAARAIEAFSEYRLVAIDEWELDDPGNLKLALAFLRGAVERRVFVAVTSNTLPLELGSGRFSQKDFRAEIEELASAFEVVRIEGDDFRRRHFVAEPGPGFFTDAERFERAARGASGAVLRVLFPDLLAGLAAVHPIRYRELVRRIDLLLVEGIVGIERLPDALRWVHFIDSVYDRGLPMLASGSIPPGGLFPGDAVGGPYGKKLSRCLSRMEEMLGEGEPGREKPVEVGG